MKTRLAALALASLALACADNGGSVQPVGICVPPNSATECVFEDTCSMTHMGPLVMDPSLTEMYVFLQMNNQLEDNADGSAGRVNTNDAYVTDFVVEWEGATIPTFEGKTQAFVPAGGSNVVMFVFPRPVASGDVVAKLKVKGHYADQSSFETAAYETPLRVRPVSPPDCPPGETFKGTCPPDMVGQIPIGYECEEPPEPTTPTP